MSLAPGTRLGVYEVIGLLGAGGMGEVYRARDTKLRREVALKVLPDAFAADPDRVARFTREAHVLATLNHPHIAAIYGVEESGGVTALVLELVDGPTLAERIGGLRAKSSGLPVAEALTIAAQIADALDAAHEKGIVHRDLKPANIKLTADDRVKVLDFGLAKALADDSRPDASLSPTMTAMASRLGVIVGTAAYMSPEQAKGKPVDKRTDVWAFGCVLYEMLTGRRAFDGEDVTDFVVAVMTKEPDWAALPATTPPRVVELLRRCLKKDPRERLRDIGDARSDLGGAIHAPIATHASGVSGPARPSRWPVVVGTLALGIAVGVAAMWGWRRSQTESSRIQTSGPLIRSVVELPANAPLAIGTQIPQVGFDSTVLSLSPDGRRLAFIGQSASGTMVYVREIGGLDITPVAGSEGAIYAFFSPDGRWLGFLTNDKVKKVSLDGGAPITLCDARVPVRATWTRDDTIYFTEDQGILLSRVAAAGGTASRAGPAAHYRLIYSQVLPDGGWALATDARRGISADYADVTLVSFETGDARVLIRSGYDARYIPPGFLLFGRGGNLFAVRFDLARREVLGDPVAITPGAGMESLFAQVHAAASDNGLIAYVPGGDRAVGRLAWVDRQGKVEFMQAPAQIYGVIDFAPNGNRLAAHVGDVSDYVWVYDITRGEGRKLQTPEPSGWPIWSPDSTRIAFAEWQSTERPRVVVRAVSGGQLEEVMSSENTRPSSWSPDGHVLAVDSLGATRGIGFLQFGGRLEQVHSDRFNQEHSYFASDSRWIVYSSTETGRNEIFVRSYPDGKIIRQISVDGGAEPVWCACGEVFFRNGNRWMSVKIRTQPELQWDPPQPAFQTDFIDTPGRSYDVSPDGKRLLVVKRAEPDVRNRINLITNWPQAMNASAR